MKFAQVAIQSNLPPNFIIWEENVQWLQILTKDSVTVFVNAIMYYRVANPIHAVANVDDYSGSARLLAATTLRNVLGTLTLGEILSQRESIAKEMRVIKYSIWIAFMSWIRDWYLEIKTNCVLIFH